MVAAEEWYDKEVALYNLGKIQEAILAMTGLLR